jgi:hypothetical protein
VFDKSRIRRSPNTCTGPRTFKFAHIRVNLDSRVPVNVLGAGSAPGLTNLRSGTEYRIQILRRGNDRSVERS